MARCYVCDAPIQGAGYRREVTVAHRSWASTGFRRGSLRIGRGNTTAKRTLCAACAKQMDDTQGAIAVVVLLAIAAFVVYCIFTGHPTPSLQ